MFGFDPLAMGSLLILASADPAQCGAIPKTKINILPSAKKTRLVTSGSLKDIQNVEIDTIDPYGLHANTMTQGFMKGKVSVQPSIKIDHKQLPGRELVCVWYEEINVKFHIDPEIHVAQEVYADDCMRKAVVEHENKHITVDRKIVNKYGRIIGNRINSELKRRGFSVGPLEFDAAHTTIEKMQKLIVNIVKEEYANLTEERQMKQQAVDNLEEYERVRNKCPHFKMALPHNH